MAGSYAPQMVDDIKKQWDIMCIKPIICPSLLLIIGFFCYAVLFSLRIKSMINTFFGMLHVVCDKPDMTATNGVFDIINLAP